MLPSVRITSPRDRTDLAEKVGQFNRTPSNSDLLNVRIFTVDNELKRIQDLDALADNLATQILIKETFKEGAPEKLVVPEVADNAKEKPIVTSEVKDMRHVSMTTGDHFVNRNHKKHAIGVKTSGIDGSSLRNNTFVVSTNTPTAKGRENNVNTVAANMESELSDDDELTLSNIIRPSNSTVDFFDQEIPISARSAQIVASSDMKMNTNNNSVINEVGEEGVEGNVSVDNANDDVNDDEIVDSDLMLRVWAVMSHQADGPGVVAVSEDDPATLPQQPWEGDSPHQMLIVQDEVQEILVPVGNANAAAIQPPPSPVVGASDQVLPNTPSNNQGQEEPAAHLPTPPAKANSSGSTHSENDNKIENQGNQSENNYECEQSECVLEGKVCDNNSKLDSRKSHLSDSEEAVNNRFSCELQAVSSTFVSQMIDKAARESEQLKLPVIDTHGEERPGGDTSITSPISANAKLSDDKSEGANQYDYEDDFEEDDECDRAKTDLQSGAKSDRAESAKVINPEEQKGETLYSDSKQDSLDSRGSEAEMASSSGKQEPSGSRGEANTHLKVISTKISPNRPAPLTRRERFQQSKAGTSSKAGVKQKSRPVERTWKSTASTSQTAAKKESVRVDLKAERSNVGQKPGKASRLSQKTVAAYAGREQRGRPTLGSLSTIRKDASGKSDRNSPHQPRTPKLPSVDTPNPPSSESSNHSAPPTLPTFGPPQTIRALGTGARKLRDIEKSKEIEEMTPKIEVHQTSKPQPSPRKSYDKPWRQQGQPVVVHTGTRKFAGSIRERQIQHLESKITGRANSGYRQRILPSIHSALRSDAYWQDGQLHIRIHGPAKLISPESASGESAAAQPTSSSEEQPTLPLDVRITLVQDQKRQNNPRVSNAGYRGPLGDARFGANRNPPSVKAERTILDTRSVHAQFQTKMARVSAMPRQRLRPLDRKPSTTHQDSPSGASSGSSK